MDAHKQLLIANGEDKTDSVVFFRFEGGKCHVQYSNTPKVYYYNGTRDEMISMGDDPCKKYSP